MWEGRYLFGLVAELLDFLLVEEFALVEAFDVLVEVAELFPTETVHSN